MTEPFDPAEILELDHRHVWHPFTQALTAPPPPVAVGGQGAHILTADGRRLLDLVSSWWVNLHGHAEPSIARAVAAQAGQIEQVLFADFTHAPAARLAARLAQLLPGDLDRVFFSDDGSTAVEVALKIALQFFANRGDPRRRLIAFDGGYHGDTVGAMSLGKSSGYFRAWEGLLFPVEVVPFPATWMGDDSAPAREAAALAALDEALAQGDVAAAVIEPLIQGAAGMRMCRPDFLRAVTARVQGAGALMVFDEVMTGFGRTGQPFACLGAGVTPDLICLSKGLTGGFLPMGATVAREGIYQAFLDASVQRAFLHGHSYTANPLGCAAGLASLELLLSTDCQARRADIEAVHRRRLGALAAAGKGHRHRLCGTIAAVNLGEGGYASRLAPVAKAFFLEHAMLIRPLGPVVYFLPPYCIAPADLESAWDVLAALIDQG